MPRLTAEDFVDADEVARLDIANQTQLDAVDRELRAAWEAAAVRAAPGATITDGQFNRSFAQMLMILASIGASNELADHPDVHIHYGVMGQDGQVANSSVNWRLIGLRPLLRRCGVTTTRRFARAYADDVYEAFKRDKPVPSTPWHVSSGLPDDFYAIAFDFADAITPELLSVDDRAQILQARRHTIRPRRVVQNLYDVAGPSVPPQQ